MRQCASGLTWELLYGLLGDDSPSSPSPSCPPPLVQSAASHPYTLPSQDFTTGTRPECVQAGAEFFEGIPSSRPTCPTLLVCFTIRKEIESRLHHSRWDRVICWLAQIPRICTSAWRWQRMRTEICTNCPTVDCAKCLFIIPGPCPMAGSGDWPQQAHTAVRNPCLVIMHVTMSVDWSMLKSRVEELRRFPFQLRSQAIGDPATGHVPFKWSRCTESIGWHLEAEISGRPKQSARSFGLWVATDEQAAQ